MKYFLHDTSALDDDKVAELFIEFGYEGVGLFYCILEKIARQEKPVKTLVLKRQLKIGKRLDKCWSFMEELGLILSQNGDTFNENLLNFSEKYKIKKEKTAKRVAEWREKQRDIENVTHYERGSNTPKVKVYKGIVNNIDSSIVVEPAGSTEKKPVLHQLLCEVWLKELHPGWTFTAQHGKEIKSIGEKFKKLLKDQNKEPTDIAVSDAFRYMCLNLPEWYKDKDLSKINSGFNEIIQQIKNLKNGNAYSKNQPKSKYAS